MIALALVLAAAVGGPSVHSPAAVQAADDLFAPAQGQGDAALASQNDKTVKRSRLVDVNAGLLPSPKQLGEGGSRGNLADTLSLNLFADVGLVIETTSAQATSNG